MGLNQSSEINSVLIVKIGIWAIKREWGKNLKYNISPDEIMYSEKPILAPHIDKLLHLISKSNLPKCVLINVSWLSKL